MLLSFGISAQTEVPAFCDSRSSLRLESDMDDLYSLGEFEYPVFRVYFDSIKTTEVEIKFRVFCWFCTGNSFSDFTDTMWSYSEHNHYFQNHGIYNLPDLLGLLSEPELVIENQDGKMRFFRGGPNFDHSGGMVGDLVGWYTDWMFDYTFPFSEFYSTFLVTPKDEKIRLFYLYVPNEEQYAEGKRATIVCSNWVDVEKF